MYMYRLNSITFHIVLFVHPCNVR